MCSRHLSVFALLELIFVRTVKCQTGFYSNMDGNLENNDSLGKIVTLNTYCGDVVEEWERWLISW